MYVRQEMCVAEKGVTINVFNRFSNIGVISPSFTFFYCARIVLQCFGSNQDTLSHKSDIA